MGNLSKPPAALEHALPWGQVARGLRWGSGEDRILLLHEPGVDIDAWAGLPGKLALRLALEVLAIDLPGHGLSDDPWDASQLPDLLRSLFAGTPGRRFVVAAGSIAGTTLAHTGEVALAGVALLTPERLVGSPLPRSPRVPKLFFAGSLAGNDLANARGLAADTGGWAIVTAFPVAHRGTALLSPPWDDRITEQIITFIRDCQRAAVPPPLPTRRMGR
jgi:pimeloyl-ACP methyl ester carboxylesterase